MPAFSHERHHIVQTFNPVVVYGLQVRSVPLRDPEAHHTRLSVCRTDTSERDAAADVNETALRDAYLHTAPSR